MHGNIFWYQRAVPKKVHKLVGIKSIKVSLKTNKVNVAIQRSKLQALEHKKMFGTLSKIDNPVLKFLNKKKDLLIAEFGYPDLTMPNDGEPPGSGKIIYISKKYGIKCQRSFEIDESDFVVGYSSKGCF